MTVLESTKLQTGPSRHDMVLDLAVMTGSLIGAFLGAITARWISGSESGLGFALLGLIAGGGLFAMIASRVAALSRSVTRPI